MLAQKLILSYGSRIIVQFIQIAASIIVARIAGPTVLGTVAFGLAFVSMFAFIADLGIGSAHIKLVSEGQDIGKCISTFSILKYVNTLFFFIVVLGVYFLQKFVFDVKFESTAHEYVIIILLIATAFNQILHIPIRTFAAKTEQAKHDIPEFTKTLIYQGLRVAIVLLGYRAVALAFGNLISVVLTIPLILYLFKGYPRAKFDRHLASKYLKISLPVFLIGVSTNVIHYLDRVVLQYFSGSEQVGYYTAGYKIGGLVLLIANSVGLLFFPLFSKAASTGNFQYIKTTIERFERFSFLFIMPTVIFLSLYSGIIIRLLLGIEYLPAVPIMAIVNVAMFLMVLNMPYGNLITGMGYFKLAAILNLLNLILFVVLVLILPNPAIFNLGAIGVAITVLVSAVFIGFLCRLFAKRKCSILDLKRGVNFIVFGIVNFAVFHFLYTNLTKVYGGAFQIIFVFMYFFATYFLFYILGWIGKRDVRDLKEIINVKKISDYIKGEIRGE
jgi:O-antigen/teichoic acid export membrane protein